jgi:hypothetical protein
VTRSVLWSEFTPTCCGLLPGIKSPTYIKLSHYRPERVLDIFSVKRNVFTSSLSFLTSRSAAEAPGPCGPGLFFAPMSEPAKTRRCAILIDGFNLYHAIDDCPHFHEYK